MIMLPKLKSSPVYYIHVVNTQLTKVVVCTETPSSRHIFSVLKQRYSGQCDVIAYLEAAAVLGNVD